jgi:hypothetical protein
MTVNWVTVVVSVAINTPAVGALLGWLGKRKLQQETQKHSEELEHLKAGYVAELERYKSELDKSKALLQAEIDRTILVTKVHFETEFGALKEVFAKLADLKFCICELHPSIRVVREDETREERLGLLKKQLERLYAAYDALLQTSEHLSPFYPQEIYQNIRQCLRIANQEDMELKLAGPRTFSLEWSKRGEENVKQFLDSYGTVSDLIKDRISKLAIIRTG